MRDAAKMPCQSSATASSSGSPGKTAFAQARVGQRLERRSHHDLLPFAQAEPDLDRYFRQEIEPLVEGADRRFAAFLEIHGMLGAFGNLLLPATIGQPPARRYKVGMLESSN